MTPIEIDRASIDDEWPSRMIGTSPSAGEAVGELFPVKAFGLVTE
jgi:hypothetical protein